jgi:hypothetical protein
MGADPDEPEMPWLLVIDQREARIFESTVSGSIPRQVWPVNGGEHFHHAHGSRNFPGSNEKPDADRYFEPIAEILQSARHLVIFGAGNGICSEMNEFIAWLKLRHPALAERIVGAVVVGEHYLTESQLLAMARVFRAPALK